MENAEHIYLEYPALELYEKAEGPSRYAGHLQDPHGQFTCFRIWEMEEAKEIIEELDRETPER
jgi:hypothetical protein